MPQSFKPKSDLSPGKPSGTKEIVEWVRERICLGQFVPGQRLVEADIIKTTGSSRGKVREALQRLEAEGLVNIEEFRGASVKQLTIDQVRQIYRARAVLEGQAAAEFAAKDAPQAKARLQELQTELDSTDSTGDHDRFARLNSQWHALIIEGSGNEYVAQFLGQLTVPIYRLLFSSFYSGQRINNANDDHRKITEAIVAGRAEDADREMRDHITNALDALADIESHFYG